MPIRNFLWSFPFTKSFINGSIVSLLIGLLAGTIYPLPVKAVGYSATYEQSVSMLTLVKDPLYLEQSILDNISKNGFNNTGSTNEGPGGLWINWRYDTSPLQTNFNGTGRPDKATGAHIRHDNLTDIRYLHALWLYKTRYPDDQRYDKQIALYTPIVKTEFANTHNERGWLYDEELMDLYKLSNDEDYKNDALSLIQAYSKRFDARIGTIYEKGSKHPRGSYRVDMVLEAGCALIQAGVHFNNPQWVQQGYKTVNFIYTHAYIAPYHIFPSQMDNVLSTDGSINPNETFFTGQAKTGYTIAGNQVRMGEVAQIALSLLHTYRISRDEDFLKKATDLLDAFSLPMNNLGIWDEHNSGYFMELQFSGTGSGNPGKMTVKTSHKEAGRQVLMLQAFHLANTLTKNRYHTMELLMINVTMNNAYYAPGHGVLYEVQADWTPNVRHKIVQDWVTTEAMGIELEGLFSISTRHPPS